MLRSKSCHLGWLILVLGISSCDYQVLVVKHKGCSGCLVYDWYFGVSVSSLGVDRELLGGSAPLFNFELSVV